MSRLLETMRENIGRYVVKPVSKITGSGVAAGRQAVGYAAKGLDEIVLGRGSEAFSAVALPALGGAAGGALFGLLTNHVVHSYLAGVTDPQAYAQMAKFASEAPLAGATVGMLGGLVFGVGSAVVRRVIEDREDLRKLEYVERELDALEGRMGH